MANEYEYTTQDINYDTPAPDGDSVYTGFSKTQSRFTDILGWFNNYFIEKVAPILTNLFDPADTQHAITPKGVDAAIKASDKQDKNTAVKYNGTTAVGSSYKPVYVDSTGMVQQCAVTIPTKVSELQNDKNYATLNSSGIVQTAAVAQSCTGNAATATSAAKCTGNSATATKLTTARNFSITGAATAGAVAFDGTQNVALNVTKLDATKLTGTASINTTGNAATATKAQKAVADQNGNTITFTAAGIASKLGNTAVNVATKATQDGNGKDIASTYSTKTELKDVLAHVAGEIPASKTILYGTDDGSRATGQTSGEIKLNDDWAKYDRLLFIFANDNREFLRTQTVSTNELNIRATFGAKYALTKGYRNYYVGLFELDGAYWYMAVVKNGKAYEHARSFLADDNENCWLFCIIGQKY